jgi:hypothetical protein
MVLIPASLNTLKNQVSKISLKGLTGITTLLYLSTRIKLFLGTITKIPHSYLVFKLSGEFLLCTPANCQAV